MGDKILTRISLRGCNCPFNTVCSLRKKKEHLHCPKYRKQYNISSTITEHKEKKLRKEKEIEDMYHRKQKKAFKKDLLEASDDVFDSMGDDISEDEFMENEAFFECL